MGNAYRRDKSIKETTITAVGRKYVTVDYYGKQFHIDGRMEKTTFSADYRLYTSQTELEEILESEDLSSRITESMPKYGRWKVEISKLRQIAEILGV